MTVRDILEKIIDFIKKYEANENLESCNRYQIEVIKEIYKIFIYLFYTI